MGFLSNAAVTVATVAIMEIVATLSHKYVLHGWGWRWHQSHHEDHGHLLEANDLYAVLFGALSAGLIVAGALAQNVLWWIGVGMTLYGFLYFFVHDGLSHRRWPFRYTPRRGYLKRLVQAHRLHHASPGRENAVSYGFLYAPPVERLLRDLKAMRRRSAPTREFSPRTRRPRPRRSPPREERRQTV